MKQIDDTEPPESESEALKRVIANLGMQINELELRIANLETQRTPQDENDDREWF